ncbi:metalloregulator ArsR/SmtB family transcription factor [uncultured Brevibacillus sp.]|uniref:ArsR/SmtB family transcription factor n=1 Tax=uncultured Brevibacillus sp. TaxID=169970 RepID=UPI002599D0D4|nr:metalloregulator ArsR/SmtB family transcription factor [uncultured Brevibacillus sp.]
MDITFETYEAKFKALADKKRLQIMYELTQHGRVNVSDLADLLDMAQSKLSYHLKILLDVNLLIKESDATMNYYELNHKEVNHLLSAELCCLFRTNNNCC